MDFLTSWLIQRLQWVYGFVVNDLHLPSKAGYIIIGLLVAVFFYDLVDIYQKRHKGDAVAAWLIILLVVPLGSLLYLFIGKQMLSKKPDIKVTVQPVKAQGLVVQPGRKVPTTIGTIVGVIAWVAGSIAVVFFVLIGIAMIQCANDPKCM